MVKVLRFLPKVAALAVLTFGVSTGASAQQQNDSSLLGTLDFVSGVTALGEVVSQDSAVVAAESFDLAQVAGLSEAEAKRIAEDQVDRGVQALGYQSAVVTQYITDHFFSVGGQWFLSGRGTTTLVNGQPGPDFRFQTIVTRTGRIQEFILRDRRFRSPLPPAPNAEPPLSEILARSRLIQAIRDRARELGYGDATISNLTTSRFDATSGRWTFAGSGTTQLEDGSAGPGFNFTASIGNDLTSVALRSLRGGTLPPPVEEEPPLSEILARSRLIQAIRDRARELGYGDATISNLTTSRFDATSGRWTFAGRGTTQLEDGSAGPGFNFTASIGNDLTSVALRSLRGGTLPPPVEEEPPLSEILARSRLIQAIRDEARELGYGDATISNLTTSRFDSGPGSWLFAGRGTTQLEDGSAGPNFSFTARISNDQSGVSLRATRGNGPLPRAENLQPLSEIQARSRLIQRIRSEAQALGYRDGTISNITSTRRFSNQFSEGWFFRGNGTTQLEDGSAGPNFSFTASISRNQNPPDSVQLRTTRGGSLPRASQVQQPAPRQQPRFPRQPIIRFQQQRFPFQFNQPQRFGFQGIGFQR